MKPFSFRRHHTKCRRHWALEGFLHTESDLPQLVLLAHVQSVREAADEPQAAAE